MNKFVVAALLATAATVFVNDSAQAQSPAAAYGYGVLPYGFYQPYGARYGTSLRTPPYFAVNPPVYYGARHARPYGISPFASLPQVAPGAGYRSRLRTQFERPPVPTPAPCNPYVCRSSAVESKAIAMGPVRQNPFVDEVDRIASTTR